MNFKNTISKLFSIENIKEWIFANKKRSVLLFGFLFLLLFIFFNNKGLLKRLQLESRKSDLKKEIEQSLNEQQNLQNYSRKLEDEPAVIESVARVKYGMVKPGEQVYKISTQN